MSKAEEIIARIRACNEEYQKAFDLLKVKKQEVCEVEKARQQAGQALEAARQELYDYVGVPYREMFGD